MDDLRGTRWRAWCCETLAVFMSLESWAITGAAGNIGSTLRGALREHLELLCCLDVHPVADLRSRRALSAKRWTSATCRRG